ncbi:MAG: GspH/FimT family pseudopilin [Pseudomonadota bacterium]
MGARRAAVNRARGFTLLELIVALAVASILIGIAIPAFNGFVAQTNLTRAANTFAGAIAYARSESTRRGGVVSLQAQAGDSDDEWGAGYCVVVGTPGDCSAPLQSFDAADRAALDGIGALNDVSTLSFNARGLLTLGQAGTLELCSDDELENPGRLIDISLIGRVSISELTCTST